MTALEPGGTTMKWLGLLAVLMAAYPGNARAEELRAGAAAVIINPPEGTPMAGYYSARGANAVLDNLYCKALVLQQGGTRVALVVCDLISLPRRTVTEARKLIEKETGIPSGHVMISATHTHTGPVVARESARDDLDGGSSDLGRRYTEALQDLIAQSVAEAKKRLGPARVDGGVAKGERLSM